MDPPKTQLTLNWKQGGGGERSVGKKRGWRGVCVGGGAGGVRGDKGRRGESHAHRRPEPAQRPSNPLRAATSRGRESPEPCRPPVSWAPGTRRGRGGAEQIAHHCAPRTEAQSSAEEPGRGQHPGPPVWRGAWDQGHQSCGRGGPSGGGGVELSGKQEAGRQPGKRRS